VQARQRPRRSVELILELRDRLVRRFAHDATVPSGHDAARAWSPRTNPRLRRSAASATDAHLRDLFGSKQPRR
jgi:hypothetical protein